MELILQSRPIIELIVERNRSFVNDKEKEKNTENVNENNQKNNQDNSLENNQRSDEKKAEDQQKSYYGDKEKEEKHSDENKQIEDEESLVNLLEQRLQFVLRSLTKLCMSKNTGNQKKE